MLTMNQKRLAGLLFLLLLVIAGIILAMSISKGNSDTSSARVVPTAVTQPPTAKDVASSLHCTSFKDLGSRTDAGVLDSGSCWIGSKKYAIDTFVSSDVRDVWLGEAEKLGVNPKWTTGNSVTYPSVGDS